MKTDNTALIYCDIFRECNRPTAMTMGVKSEHKTVGLDIYH